jgi:hypothetical protein
MQISKCETIVDEKKFVESHTATVERNKDNKWFESYKKRLDDYNRATKEKVRNAD